MRRDQQLDELRRHQDAAEQVLAEGVAGLDDGPEAMRDAAPELHDRLAATLGAYQTFKHAQVFDPAIASDDPARAALARDMKVACIGAGEVFRVHMQAWTPEQIAADWENYRVAARLTANQLRRHIATERVGIAELIQRYG